MSSVLQPPLQQALLSGTTMSKPWQDFIQNMCKTIDDVAATESDTQDQLTRLIALLISLNVIPNAPV